MAKISDLPPEVILLIFRFYAEIEGQKALIRKVSRVCPFWKNICMNNTLWITLDDTVSFSDIMRLCKMECLNYTKELCIRQTEALNHDNAEKLFPQLKNLEILSLLNVDNLPKETFAIIASNCFKLKAIRIDKVELIRKISLADTLMDSFFTLRGISLTTVVFSKCTVTNTQLLLRCIADCCPNLETLLFKDISNCSARIFPTMYFQEHCSKLRTLFLDWSVTISEKRHSSGFPDLEVFAYVDDGSKNLTDRSFESVVFNSPKLRFLNLTLCHVSSEALCSIPATSVEHLYIAKSKAINENNLCNVFRKWCHSLEVVDISYSTNCSINPAVYKLIMSPAKSPLETLRLNFTKVLPSVILKILIVCDKLKELSTLGCRNLERGMKRLHEGESELNILKKKIETYFNNNPNERCPEWLD